MIKNSDKYVQSLRKRAQDIAVPPVNSRSGTMIFNLIIAALLILVFALNILVLVLLKGSRLDKNSLTQRLDNIETTLKDNGESLNQVDLKINVVKKAIKEINSFNEAQLSAIENLTKAKNNIFTRVTELEAKK